MPPLILLLRYCRPSLRLPNGCLSPMAFQPVPRSGATPAVAAAGGGAAGCLLLPSQELPITFSLLWEQQLDAGGPCAVANFSHLFTESADLLPAALAAATWPLPSPPCQLCPHCLHSLPLPQDLAASHWRATWPQIATATCCFAC